jgi:hypothetical protein
MSWIEIRSDPFGGSKCFTVVAASFSLLTMSRAKNMVGTTILNACDGQHVMLALEFIRDSPLVRIHDTRRSAAMYRIQGGIGKTDLICSPSSGAIGGELLFDAFSVASAWTPEESSAWAGLLTSSTTFLVWAFTFSCLDFVTNHCFGIQIFFRF